MTIVSNEPGDVATAGERIWIQLENDKEIHLMMQVTNVLGNILMSILTDPIGGWIDTICWSISLKTPSSKTVNLFPAKPTQVIVKFPIIETSRTQIILLLLD